jgi:hypothetical protein
MTPGSQGNVMSSSKAPHFVNPREILARHAAIKDALSLHAMAHTNGLPSRHRSTDHADMENGIELRKVVDQLREELGALTQTAGGEELQFAVEGIELELRCAVTKGGSADAKAKFWVLELGAKGEYKTDNTQTIKLKLRPIQKGAKAGTETRISR